MVWMHRWVGLLLGWLLFPIFLCGTLAVFETEITLWMQPERQGAGDPAEAVQTAEAYLRAAAPQADSWRIMLPDRRQPSLIVAWSGQDGQVMRYLDPATGTALEPRQTMGGRFFLDFHYRLLMGNLGLWLVGIAAMAMLALLVAGVIVHRRIFVDFFTFRPGAASQRAWLDAHNATGVLLLPFHFMIAYTGLAIFFFTYMPAGVQVLYGGDQNLLFAAMAPPPASRASSGEAAPLLSLERLAAEARQRLGGEAVWLIDVAYPGDAAAFVTVHGHWQDRVARINDRVVLDGVDGSILADRVETVSTPYLVFRFLAGMHRAQFADSLVRWLYFVCGLAGSATIAAGLVLFSVKRRRSQAEGSPGIRAMLRFAEAMTTTVTTGLAVACAAYLWGNRLIPGGLADRAFYEAAAFFAVWLLALGHALARAAPRAWLEQLGLCAALCLLLPLLDRLTAATGEWQSSAFDCAFLAIGVLFALGALLLARRLR